MRKHKRGFTLIEVILFLALTTALFVGIAAGVGSSVYQQRYTDAVQNYAEFLRSVYSQVVNVQNENTGRSDKAIYGKIVTFKNDGGNNVIRTYNLIGDAEQRQSNGQIGTGVDATGNTVCESNDGSIPGRLRCLGANVLVEEVDQYNNPTGQYKPVGFVENYSPRWGSAIQTRNGWSEGSGYETFEGIMLITHSPSTGNISTYLWTGDNESTDQADDSDAANKISSVIDNIESCSGLDPANRKTGQACDVFKTGPTFSSDDTYMSGTNFKAREIDFCLNPRGVEQSGIRRDIRVVKGAKNASGVNVLDEDTPVANPNYDDFDVNRCQ